MSQGQGGWGGPPGGNNGSNGSNGNGWNPFGAPPPAAPFGAPPSQPAANAPGSPQGGYGAPPGGYGAPPGGYGAPPGGYGAPPGGYGAPPGGFNPPPFGSPPGGYGGHAPQGNPYAPGFMPQPPRNPRQGIVVGVVIGLISVSCVACGVAAYLSDKHDQETFGPLKAACDGQGVPGAHPYAPGPGVHRVVGAERNGTNGWRIANGRIPNSQLAQGVSDAEAVVCFGQETEATVGRCEIYSTNVGVRVPGSERVYDQVQRSLGATVVNAVTGQTLLVGSIQGPAPRTCEVHDGEHPTAGDFRSALPGSSEVGPWVSNLLSSGGAALIPIGR